MKTKEAFSWARVFSAGGSIEVPAGAPVEYHAVNKAYYVQPRYFNSIILQHDANEVIDKSLNGIDSISNITFTGGEPSLAVDRIRLAKSNKEYLMTKSTNIDDVRKEVDVYFSNTELTKAIKHIDKGKKVRGMLLKDKIEFVAQYICNENKKAADAKKEAAYMLKVPKVSFTKDDIGREVEVQFSSLKDTVIGIIVWVNTSRGFAQMQARVSFPFNFSLQQSSIWVRNEFIVSVGPKVVFNLKSRYKKSIALKQVKNLDHVDPDTYDKGIFIHNSKR